jgi:hypothetical protein
MPIALHGAAGALDGCHDTGAANSTGTADTAGPGTRPSLVVATFGRQVLVETDRGVRVRCQTRGKRSELVVGDRARGRDDPCAEGKCSGEHQRNGGERRDAERGEHGGGAEPRGDAGGTRRPPLDDGNQRRERDQHGNPRRRRRPPEPLERGRIAERSDGKPARAQREAGPCGDGGRIAGARRAEGGCHDVKAAGKSMRAGTLR